MCDKSHVFVLSDSKALALSLSIVLAGVWLCVSVCVCAKYALKQLPNFVQMFHSIQKPKPKEELFMWINVC